MLGFAAANPTLGYTQGMSDLLAPLLVTLGTPADAYWALDALIKRSAAVICPRDDVMDVQLVSRVSESGRCGSPVQAADVDEEVAP